MSTRASAPRLNPLVADLFPVSSSSGVRSSLGWLLAVSLHAGIFGLALGRHAAQAKSERPPVEVEFVQPPPPAPPPEPEPLRPESPEPPTVAHAQPAKAPAAPAPAAARAGALHTAKADAAPPAADDPLDFTHDPNAMGFGGGVVAIGGTASFGAKGALPTANPAPPAPGQARRGTGEALTLAADLGRKPSLGESDPCRGYFPRNASDDSATASVLVVIGSSGAVSKVTLLSENPSSQGFGAAARTCMQSKRFVPALDRAGRPTATAIRVNVRFTR
ncbi:MAG TPA: energy transducer TonB [Polyangiaceae bacterium]|nr:energy transducer TonB [Polyangiaceae bacterium]